MTLQLRHTETWLTAIYLFVLYVLAIFFRGQPGFFANESLRAGALLGSFGVVHLLGMVRWQAKPRLENLLITVLILLLLSDPDTPIIKMAALGLVAGLIKTLIRITNEPVFNPAAAGLFIASLFGVVTTWWGVSFAPRLPFYNMSIAALFTIPIGVHIILRYQKLPTLISAPMSLAVSYFIFAGRLPITILLEGTFAFFLLFMVSEPKTTPVIDWQEWIHGLLLGSLLGFLFVNRLVDSPYIVTLLFMNLLYSIYRFLSLKALPMQ